MKKNYRIIVKLMGGMVFVAALLGACNLGKTPTPAPAPEPTPETDILTFTVRVVLDSKAAKGFNAYKHPGQKLYVRVPKGQTVAAKSAITAAIKAKTPELQAETLELYKGSNKKSTTFAENDPDLRNNQTVYVGKASYSNTVTITVKSVETNYTRYQPVATYSEGKSISVTVADTADTSAIVTTLRAAIKRDVGINYDAFYKLFSDDHATVDAPDSLFADSNTVYIGKRPATVMVKTLTAGSALTVGTDIYYPVNAYADGGKVLTAVIAENADSAAISHALKQAIKNAVGTAIYDNLYKLFSTASGGAEVSSLTDGCTVYIAKKARVINVTFKSITNTAPLVYPGPPSVSVSPAGAPFAGTKEVKITVQDNATTAQIAQLVKTQLIADIGGLPNYEKLHFYRDTIANFTNHISPDTNPADFIDGCTVYVGAHP